MPLIKKDRVDIVLIRLSLSKTIILKDNLYKRDKGAVT